jgi:hypothetical protein
MSDSHFDLNQKLDNILISVDSINENETFTAVISTDKINDNGWRFNQDGIDYSDYEKNPVLLPWHSADLPSIGRAYGFKVVDNGSNGKKTICQIEFDKSPEGQTFKNWYKIGKMRAFSGGFKALEAEEFSDHIYFPKSKMKELSCVTVGADSDALLLNSFINTSKSIKIKKHFENILLNKIIEDYKLIKEINVENMIENKFKELELKINSLVLDENSEVGKKLIALACENEKLRAYIEELEKKINESVNQISQNKNISENKRLIDLQNSIKVISDNNKKINKMLETFTSDN